MRGGPASAILGKEEQGSQWPSCPVSRRTEVKPIQPQRRSEPLSFMNISGQMIVKIRAFFIYLLQHLLRFQFGQEWGLGVTFKMLNTSPGLPPPFQSQNNVSGFPFLEMKRAEAEAHFFTLFRAHLENYLSWENVGSYANVNIYLKEKKKERRERSISTLGVWRRTLRFGKEIFLDSKRWVFAIPAKILPDLVGL